MQEMSLQQGFGCMRCKDTGKVPTTGERCDECARGKMKAPPTFMTPEMIEVGIRELTVGTGRALDDMPTGTIVYHVYKAMRELDPQIAGLRMTVTPDHALRRWPKLMAQLSALAAGSGTAETGETPAQCEASQSGDAKAAQRPTDGGSNVTRD